MPSPEQLAAWKHEADSWIARQGDLAKAGTVVVTLLYLLTECGRSLTDRAGREIDRCQASRG